MFRPVSIRNIVRIIFFPLAFLLCIYAAKLSLISLVRDKLTLLSEYISLRGNPEALKHTSLLIEVSERVKAMIPPDACIEVSRVSLPLLLSFRYYVYPLKVVVAEVNDFNNEPRVCNGHYFVDLNEQIKSIPANWHEVRIKKWVRLFAIEDSPVYVNRSPPPTIAPWSFWAYFCFVIIEFLIGCFLLCGFIPHVGGWPLSGKLGGSFLFGFIGVTFPFWIFALLKCPLTELSIYMGMCILMFSSYLFMKKRSGDLAKAFPIRQFVASEVLCNLGGLIAIFFYFLLIVSFRVGIVDEVHIWILKAKIFFDLRGLSFDYTEIITNYYPIFWPLNLTLQFIFTAGNHDQIAKWTSALVFISSLGVLKSAAIFLGFSRKTSWWVVFVFLVFFHHWTFFTALTENIFIALMLLSVTFFIDWMRSKTSGSLYATALSLIGLCGVKFEGTVVVGFFFIAFMLSKKNKLSDLWPRLKTIMPLAVAFAMQPLWLCWLTSQGVHYSIFHLRGQPTPANIISIIKMTGIYLSNTVITEIIIFLAVFFPMLIRNTRAWSQEERFVLFITLCLILFAYNAGLCWSSSDFWQYYPEVWLRLMSRAMPFAVLLWMSRILVVRKED